MSTGELVLCRTGRWAGAVAVVLSASEMLVDGRRVPLDVGAVLRLGACLDADALLAGDVERVCRSVRVDAEQEPADELAVPSAGAAADTGSLVLVTGESVRLGVVAADVVEGAPLAVNLDGLVWSVPAADVLALGISVDWAVTWGDEDELLSREGRLVHVGVAPCPEPEDDAQLLGSLSGVLADPVLARVWEQCRANPETGGVDRVLLGWFGAEVAKGWDEVPESSRRVLWAAVEDAQDVRCPPRVGRAWLEDFLEVLVLHRSWAGDSVQDVLALAGPAARQHARLFRDGRWHRAEVADAD